MRTDGRPPDQLRPVKVTRNFTQVPAGSVLWEQGRTIILCTASVTPEVPPWFPETRPGGWVTAEYVMLPASTPQRKGWPKTGGPTDSRGTEIQRLIGRCVRGVIDLSKLGPHTIAIDCQVLQADGGTRTASVCAAYVALADALARLPAQLPAASRQDPSYYQPKTALVDQLAAVSVGIVDGEVRLDLDYKDDAAAHVDLNVACTAGGKFVEVQGSAEKLGGYARTELDRMLDLGVRGCEQLMGIQRKALARHE
jgi:ribonuclease PH